MIISFGYKYGAPEHRIDKTFDIRDLTHNTASPEFLNKFQEIVDYGKTHKAGSIAIGCEKGMHRSVVMAQKVASALRRSLYLRDSHHGGK